MDYIILLLVSFDFQVGFKEEVCILILRGLLVDLWDDTLLKNTFY